MSERPQDEPPRLLAELCLACNREACDPMCARCDAMTRAEEAAEQGHALERLYGAGCGGPS